MIIRCQNTMVIKNEGKKTQFASEILRGSYYNLYCRTLKVHSSATACAHCLRCHRQLHPFVLSVKGRKQQLQHCTNTLMHSSTDIFFEPEQQLEASKVIFVMVCCNHEHKSIFIKSPTPKFNMNSFTCNRIKLGFTILLSTRKIPSFRPD